MALLAALLAALLMVRVTAPDAQVKWHPDKNPENVTEAERRFKEVPHDVHHYRSVYHIEEVLIASRRSRRHTPSSPTHRCRRPSPGRW